jgi:alpha-N-arabinofuranosidase
LDLKTADYALGGASVPMLHGSASRDRSGRLHLSIVNLDLHQPAVVAVSPVSGNATGRVLTATTMNAHNTFVHPDAVRPAPFDGFTKTDNAMTLTLPPKSVVMLEIR